MDPETPLQEQTSINSTENQDTTIKTDKETPIVPPSPPSQLHSLDLATLQLHQLQQLSNVQATVIAEAAAALTGKTTAESYQQIFTNFDQSAAFAAAAAAALAACSNQVTGSPQQAKAPNLVNIAPLPSAELIKRELMNQKVRADNRERKKRWRLQNEERNKDNDLRCRVNKRAHKLFGKEDSDHKKRWVQDEFEKRQQKRKEKERRRGLVDNSLSGHNDAGLAAIAQQLMTPQTDANNYLTLLSNNLGMTSRPEVAKQEMAQFPLQLLELLQQLQQYQQEPPPPPPVELPEEDGKAEEKLAALIASTFQAVLVANGSNKSEIQPNHNEHSPEFPMDAVMTLMQLNAGTINTNDNYSNNKDTL